MIVRDRETQHIVDLCERRAHFANLLVILINFLGNFYKKDVEIWQKVHTCSMNITPSALVKLNKII